MTRTEPRDWLCVDDMRIENGRLRVRAHRARGHCLPVFDPPRYKDRPRRKTSTDLVLLDVCGRVRSPATMPGIRRGKKPPNHGLKYPAQPLTNTEALAILGRFGKHPAGIRDRALFALMWRSGLRIECEALALMPGDLNPDEGLVHVRCGKGSKARTVPMDPAGWEYVNPWLEPRAPSVSPGSSSTPSGGRRRPHQLRHTLACDLVREEWQLPYVQRMLGHSSPATTGVYLAGLPAGELFAKAAQRPAPVGVVA